jgi:hypothetical protein
MINIKPFGFFYVSVSPLGLRAVRLDHCSLGESFYLEGKTMNEVLCAVCDQEKIESGIQEVENLGLCYDCQVLGFRLTSWESIDAVMGGI